MGDWIKKYGCGRKVSRRVEKKQPGHGWGREDANRTRMKPHGEEKVDKSKKREQMILVCKVSRKWGVE